MWTEVVTSRKGQSEWQVLQMAAESPSMFISSFLLWICVFPNILHWHHLVMFFGLQFLCLGNTKNWSIDFIFELASVWYIILVILPSLFSYKIDLIFAIMQCFSYWLCWWPPVVFKRCLDISFFHTKDVLIGRLFWMWKVFLRFGFSFFCYIISKYVNVCHNCMHGSSIAVNLMSLLWFLQWSI